MYKPKICVICGAAFSPNCGAQKGCSPECRHQVMRRNIQDYQAHKRVRLPNHCNICGVVIPKRQHRCAQHKGREWVQVKAKYEQMLTTNEAIIKSQQQQIDELNESNAQLRRENRHLAQTLEVFRDERFDPRTSSEIARTTTSSHLLVKDFGNWDG